MMITYARAGCAQRKPTIWLRSLIPRKNSQWRESSINIQALYVADALYITLEQALPLPVRVICICVPVICVLAMAKKQQRSERSSVFFLPDKSTQCKCSEKAIASAIAHIRVILLFALCHRIFAVSYFCELCSHHFVKRKIMIVALSFRSLMKVFSQTFKQIK